MDVGSPRLQPSLCLYVPFITATFRSNPDSSVTTMSTAYTGHVMYPAGPAQCDQCGARGTVADFVGWIDVASMAATRLLDVQPEAGNPLEHGKVSFIDISGPELQCCVSAGAQLVDGVLTVPHRRGCILSQGAQC